MGRKRNARGNSAPSNRQDKSVVRTLVVAPNGRGVADIGKWRSAIKSADRGRVRQLYDLFDDLMLDGVLSDAIDKRIKAVINADFSFYNAKGEMVKLVVDDIIDSSAFEDLIKSLMMAEMYGRGGAELSMQEDGFHVDYIPPQHIDLLTKQIIPDLMKWDNGLSYEGLNHVIVTGKEREYGLMVKAAQYAIYKRGGFGDWAQWIELFGMPQRIGKYHANDPEGKRQIIQALHEMGSCSYMATPYETEIEVKDTQKGSGEAYDDFRKALNEEMLITILGQTLTTVAGERGARSLGDVHMDVEQSKNKSDIRFVTRLLNERLVPFLEARGYAEASGGYFSTPSEVEKTSVDDIVKLSGIIPIPNTYIYDRYGIPKPAKGEDVAGAKQAELPTEPEDKSDKSDEPKEPKEPKALKKKLMDFFVDALIAAQGSLRNWTTSITTLAANDNSVGFDVKALVLEALRQLHKGEYEEAVKQLFSANDQPLQRGLDMVFDTADDELFPFVEEFKYNTSVFNAFKTHAEMDALYNALTDKEGNLRSFRQFRKAVEPIIGRYNEQWLRTEYNTAIHAADAARYYQEALRTKHIFPNLEYIESKAKDKREEHREWVGTILPIEHSWWDIHMPPKEWNCQCGVKKTRKPATDVPAEGEDDRNMPSVLRQNPGKSASPFKLDEHPYLKGKGEVTCPECRRQELVNGSKLSDEESQLCPMHRLAYNGKKRRELIRSRRELYKELLNNPNYLDVCFDPKTGGLKATHKNHNFDKVGGQGEYMVQELGYKNGHSVILEEEVHSIPNRKNTDGRWNGRNMEIAMVKNGTANNIRNSLKHCAKKPNVQVAVLNITSEECDLEHGLAKYNGLKGTSQWVQFDELIVIHKNKIVAYYT
ncbi:hypothetical protein IX308_000436 [Porphyromonas levii]|uniref:phage portal protein family protein n=1 Tax=Porphyromonas levii TaxID=28114 RepID=UPI001BADFA9E|nr:DUF935 family protein [Porphyromonas levii]MBR8784267.1 hypothetical protein [Porphyromonas levii]